MSGNGMRAVDTNILVRLIARDDRRQAALADGFIEKGAWVPILVLAEAVWVLATVYGRDDAALATAIALLLDHRTLVLQDADVVATALDVFRSRRGPGFSDCLILELARKAGHLPLGTFDRRLARMDGAQMVSPSAVPR